MSPINICYIGGVINKQRINSFIINDTFVNNVKYTNGVFSIYNQGEQIPNNTLLMFST